MLQVWEFCKSARGLVQIVACDVSDLLEPLPQKMTVHAHANLQRREPGTEKEVHRPTFDDVRSPILIDLEVEGPKNFLAFRDAFVTLEADIACRIGDGRITNRASAEAQHSKLGIKVRRDLRWKS